MPRLKDVIPELQEQERLRDSQAYQHRNQQVTQVKLTTGAPCSTHDELFESWPGESTDVAKWYTLDNGFAVGCGVDLNGNPHYPVVRLKPVS